MSGSKGSGYQGNGTEPGHGEHDTDRDLDQIPADLPDQICPCRFHRYPVIGVQFDLSAELSKLTDHAVCPRGDYLVDVFE
jgi:hypothetical protein